MFIQTLALKDFLSFQDASIELGPVNVLIGANGSGKSNLIDAIDFLRHCPQDLSSFVLNEGGAEQWIRRAGAMRAEVRAQFKLAAVMDYALSFEAERRAPRIVSEVLAWLMGPDPGGAIEFARTPGHFDWGFFQDVVRPKVESRDLKPLQAFLSQYRSPSADAISTLSENLEKIRIYRNFATGKRSPMRLGAPVVSEAPTLKEDGSNLAYALHELDSKEQLSRVNEFLAEFATHYVSVKAKVVNGAWTLQLREAGLETSTPTERMSDGTLKFLCLLAILLDPNPPPLICIEEPEVGLHPEAIALVARAMEVAGERTQLVVTTHSEALVDRFSDQPEAVIVCEKDANNATTLKRQTKQDLASWLEDYSLGSLWQRGVLGGNRR